MTVAKSSGSSDVRMVEAMRMSQKKDTNVGSVRVWDLAAAGGGSANVEKTVTLCGRCGSPLPF